MNEPRKTNLQNIETNYSIRSKVILDISNNIYEFYLKKNENKRREGCDKHLSDGVKRTKLYEISRRFMKILISCPDFQYGLWYDLVWEGYDSTSKNTDRHLESLVSFLLKRLERIWNISTEFLNRSDKGSNLDASVIFGENGLGVCIRRRSNNDEESGNMIKSYLYYNLLDFNIVVYLLSFLKMIEENRTNRNNGPNYSFGRETVTSSFFKDTRFTSENKNKISDAISFVIKMDQWEEDYVLRHGIQFIILLIDDKNNLEDHVDILNDIRMIYGFSCKQLSKRMGRNDNLTWLAELVHVLSSFLGSFVFSQHFLNGQEKTVKALKETINFNFNKECARILNSMRYEGEDPTLIISCKTCDLARRQIRRSEETII
jgi:hypothetical protein